MPPDLCEVIYRCLEKRCDARYFSVSELAHALAPFASAEGMAKAGDVFATAERSVPRLSRPDASSGQLAQVRLSSSPDVGVGSSSSGGFRLEILSPGKSGDEGTGHRSLVH